MTAAIPARRRPKRRAGSRSGLHSDLRTYVGLGLVGCVVLLAVCAPGAGSVDVAAPDFANTLAPPSKDHLLGTDDLGRDILARVMSGATPSLLVGSLSVAIGLVAGTAAGLVAGYGGRWVDIAVMRLMDILAAFPGVLLALAIVAVLGPGLYHATLALGIINLPTFARLARGQTLVIRELGYVEARVALGFHPADILLRTITPNVLRVVVVQGSLLFGSSIITESYLSFLGLGVQPPTPTWGSMLHEAVDFLDIAPWFSLFPGGAIFLTVLGLNLLGDGAADRLSPRPN